jgi:hypothetical protein
LLRESLLVRFSILVYCAGVVRDSPYSVANAKVRKASKPSGASSPSWDGTSETFVGGRVLGLWGLRLGVVLLAVARGIVAAIAGLGLVPAEAVTSYIGLTVLKGLA